MRHAWENQRRRAARATYSAAVKPGPSGATAGWASGGRIATGYIHARRVAASSRDSNAIKCPTRDNSWVGYKAETCDPETPHEITNVETTPATTPDDNMVTVVHQSLEKSGLLPSEHLGGEGPTV
jgi:hypothetical protein